MGLSGAVDFLALYPPGHMVTPRNSHQELSAEVPALSLNSAAWMYILMELCHCTDSGQASGFPSAYARPHDAEAAMPLICSEAATRDTTPRNALTSPVAKGIFDFWLLARTAWMFRA